MNISRFLTYLRNIGINITSEGNRLRYKAPKGVMTEALKAELTERRSEILTWLKRETNLREPDIQPLNALKRFGPLPLSYAQQRLWFLDQLAPNNPSYNIAGAVRILGRLKIEVLRRVIDEIVRRHETLRTSFVTIEAQPFQTIAPESRIEISIENLSRLAPDERERQAHNLAIEHARLPFNLARGPLFSVGLIVLGEREHRLIMTMHHIIADGWSMEVLVREITKFYKAFSEGRPSMLPELGIQYVDYARWQRQYVESDVLSAQIDYWKKRLAGVPPLLEIPADHARPLMPAYIGARQAVSLNSKLTSLLRKLCLRENATMSMVLLAAFKVLLNRYSQQTDIVVGTPVAGRNRAEIKGLIGYFANTLAIRTDLSGDLSFRQIIGQVRDRSLEAYAHQDVPFEKIVEELQPERELSRSPLFQVTFVMQNSPMTSDEVCGLKLLPEQIDIGTSKFDLTLSMQEVDDELSGWLEYNTELYEATTISKMIGHLQTILETMAVDPDRRMSAFDMLTTQERREIIEEWNDVVACYSVAMSLGQMFELQADISPNEKAVVFGAEEITYKELDELSNRMAHYLKTKGVGPETTVGIYVNRSVRMMVAVLAILKAGGAYVPLDLRYPKQRLEDMIEDGRVKVLVTERHLEQKLINDESRTIYLDTDWDTILRYSPMRLGDEIDPDNLAYVIYTSGSTGKPKGIGLPHRALMNLIEWNLATMLRKAKTIQFAPLSFDASFQEMFSAWCSGGTLFLLSERERLDTSYLIRFITDAGIEKLILPVVVLQQLAEEYYYSQKDLSSLKEVIVTGEQLQITTPIINLFKHLKCCSLVNHYGPSETHVVTAHKLPIDPDLWPLQPPLGRPIANTQVYILDPFLKPVPAGVTGEIYIAGESLARGYFDQPGMTADRFIPNPFAAKSGQRMYRTGDMARHLPNGEIEFLGRKDNQVKIRGFRIELGEIEAVLGQYPALREAVVTVHESAPDDKRLVAYAVASQEQAPTVADLRCFLRERLPEYMLPSAFVLMNKLPLTLNGKIDRRALPVPDHIRPEMETDFIVPRTPAEEVVAGIWSRVLGVPQVGAFDNFFRLGGHSLLATQSILRLREVFLIDLPVCSLFENPTVDGLIGVMAQLWGGREIVEEIAWTLTQIEQLSEEEASVMLSKQAVE